MDMFEDECQRASWRRHGAIARGIAKRGLVAFLAFAMAFGTTPAQLWAEGAEGIAESVAQAATGGEGAAAEGADDDAVENAAGSDNATAGDAVNTEGSAAPVSVASEQGDASDSVAVSAHSAYVTVNSAEIIDADGNGLAYGSGIAKVGDTVKVAAYYWDDYDWDDVEISQTEYAKLGYQWYVGNSQSTAPTASGYSAIEGATARELKLTSNLAGKYVACRVTYGAGAGDYEFTASLKNPVEASAEPEAPKSDDAKKLDEAVAKLKADGYSGWYPNPSQGTDTNICSMLSAKLANLGYSDIKVSLAGVTYGGRDPKQDGGIADDGKISYFFLSPADKTSALDYSLLRQFTPTYTLTLGSANVSYTPGRASTLAWDGGKVIAYLKAAWAHAEGLPDEIEAGVTQGTLPSSISINGIKVASIDWMSLDDSVAKVNSSYGDPTVTYTHGMTDQTAWLTATLSLAVPGYNNAPSNGTAYLVTYTVKAKTQEQIDAEKAELSAALDRIVLKDFATQKVIDANAVEGDIQLPNTRRSGIDAPSGAKLSYASNDEAVAKVNGYRVVVTRDIEGVSNEVVITATLAKDGITVTRDIIIKVKPIDDSEIDQAVAFMQQVKDAYAKSLLGDNASVDAVTENLSTFAEAVPTADGGIEYRKGKDSKLSGVVAADLPGYDAMSGNDWRTYRTSDTSVISNENLKVTRPEADTLVTVESNLTYAKYESLAKAHPENAKLQSLINQSVKATYRVVGTVDHSDPKISVAFKLVGIDADGNDEVWADSAKSVVYGSTAGDVIEDALKGMTHTATGVGTASYYLSDITSADGRKLGWDASTGKYWQLFVNGKASEVGAGQVHLAPGDSVVLYYSAFGASLDDANKATVKASVSFIGPAENGGNSVWASASDVKMSDGSTAADLTEQELKAAGLTYDSQDTSGASFYLASITRNGKTYGWDQSTGRYWQLYVNGEYSQKMAGQITLKPGDKVQWVYAADNEKPLEGLIVNPFASRPDWTASWNGFGNAGGTTLVNTPTPTESAAELWKVNLATAADKWVSLGDPIIAGGYVFVTTNSELVKIDNAGKVVARVSKGGTTNYFSRPVYADGLIISANDDGSVYAFSAETLECVWKTSALEAPAAGGRYQANSTMTVANGCVYAEFVTGAGASGTATGGAMVCIDIATGKIVWSDVITKTGSSTGEGYYWAGAAASGSDLVIGDESGCVKLIDGKSGKVKSSVSLSGNPVRATIVSAGTEGGNPVFLAIGRQPATLYKIVREGDALRLADSCEFAKVSTSTPAVANGKVYVGGSDSSNNGQFTVVDLASMKVEKTLDMGKMAEVKASPIASVQGSDVYVYFTCNKTPGAVYCFNQSTGEAVEIYTPSGPNANYCTASVIADVQGNLYYTNDSGTLFALKAAPGYTVAFDTRGGSTVPSAMTAQNKTMIAPANPERSGYTFAGWYKDADCNQAWNFSKDAVTADMTLYAKWTKNTVAPGGNGGSGSNGGNGGSGNAGAGSGSGNGTNGQQTGGAVAPGQKPVSTTTKTETKDGKDSKKDSGKGDKKDSKKSDKKSGKSSSKSDTGSAAAATAKKSAEAPVQQSGFNPLAIVGVAAGVIGLAVIGVFVFTKRR
ncbi:DUF4430 domain-containing protein [Collinsella sp. LCP19S3_H3]|uniref:DUF4430 domain-containing protein n=1 Tax=Collinsella sp. LCP19S3_H3 TaxID=3438768 RepID=UPI003F93AB62